MTQECLKKVLGILRRVIQGFALERQSGRIAHQQQGGCMDQQHHGERSSKRVKKKKRDESIKEEAPEGKMHGAKPAQHATPEKEQDGNAGDHGGTTASTPVPAGFEMMVSHNPAAGCQLFCLAGCSSKSAQDAYQQC